MIETTSVVFHHHRDHTIVAVFKRPHSGASRKLVATYHLQNTDAHADPGVLLQALLDASPWRTYGGN